jgi:integrase
MTGLADFHIHDLRHHAITRVAETGQFTLPELQQFSGHRDIRMLMRYAHLCATRLAKKLDECFKDAEMVRNHRGRLF